MLVGGIFSALCAGLCMPLLAFVMGSIIEIYQPDAEPAELRKQFAILATLIIIVAIIIFVGGAL